MLNLWPPWNYSLEGGREGGRLRRRSRRLSKDYEFLPATAGAVIRLAMIQHVAGDAGGLPLSVTLSAADASDSTMSEAVVDDIPPIRMPTGSRRRRPAKVRGDKAYDHRRCRACLRRRGIQPRIARRMIESSQRLGRHRWTIERTGAWLGGWRRLRIRYERSSERFYALAMLACSVICFNTLQQPPWGPLRIVLLRALAPAPFP